MTGLLNRFIQTAFTPLYGHANLSGALRDPFHEDRASVAQLVEQLIRNQ